MLIMKSNFFSHDLAIDLGTSNVLVYARGKGVVYNEPCVVAVSDEGGGRRRVLAVGTEAKNMLGRTSTNVHAIRPIRNGVISDFEIAGEMLRRIIKKVQNFPSFFRPKIVISVPHGVTEVEKRAVRESAHASGASEVFLIEEPMAAAIGAGLPVTEACGSMVIDIGGGTTEIAIISMKGIVYSRSIRIGGDHLDEAVQNMVRRKYNVLIGERTAEQLKIEIGSAIPSSPEVSREIRGRDLLHGVPKSVEVNSEHVREAIGESLAQILEAIFLALEKTPPELASDIVDRGITLTGGGALLRGLDRLISQVTALPVVVADEPLSTVVMGSGSMLDQPTLLREIMIS